MTAQPAARLVGRPRVHGRLGVVGLSAAVAAAVIVPTALSRPHERDTPALSDSVKPATGTATRPNGAPDRDHDQPAAVHKVSEPTAERAADAVYAVLDADYGTGYYMLRTDATEATITIWGSFSSNTLVAAREKADNADMRLQVLPLPRPQDPRHLQDRVERLGTSDRLHADAAAAGYGFCFLKMEYPLETIVLWRVHPDPGVDARLTSIAAEAGMTLDLRVATLSEADADELGADLRAQNDEWQRKGFTVEGAHARPAGAVVFVSGDAAAARAALADDPRILTIVNVTVVPF